MIRFIISIPQQLSLLFIRGYQKTISPDHSWLRHAFPFGYCKFHPTCSEYGRQAIHKHGFVIGWGKAVWRILRCNPFSKGGVDEV